MKKDEEGGDDVKIEFQMDNSVFANNESLLVLPRGKIIAIQEIIMRCRNKK